MIAALIVVVSIYIAVRMYRRRNDEELSGDEIPPENQSGFRTAMTELFQNIQSLYRKWEEKADPKVSLYLTSQSNDEERIAKAIPTNDNDMTVENRNFENQLRSREDDGRVRTTMDGEIVDGRRERRIGNGGGRTFSTRFTRSSRFRLPTISLPQWDRIAHFKVAPVVPEMSAQRPSMGDCCPHCVPLSKLAFSNDPSSTLGIHNVLNVPTQNRQNGIIARTFFHLAFLVRRGVYYPYPEVSNTVLKCEKVQEAITMAVEDDIKSADLSVDNIDPEVVEALKRKHYTKASNGLHRMRSCISSALLRLAGWVLYKLLGRMLTGIQVHKGHIENLKKISKRKVPIIYLPLHRSHLDYILVTFILYINDLQAPIIAAGDNLLIPFFGSLMRGLGAFFIKRKMDRKDFVYRAILHSYTVESLKAGHSLEFFIEGGRSRTGKACMPKTGLLSVVVDSILSGSVEDVFIVPVGISYEKILEGNFVMEQLGKPKVMENFTTAVRAIWSTLHSNFGNVRVDFCQPYSLKEFIQSAKRRHSSVFPPRLLFGNGTVPECEVAPERRKSSNSSLYGLDVVPEDIRDIIHDLANHVVHDASNSTALMSTNLLAFLLLTKHRKGATLQQLSQSMLWLKQELANRKRDVGFSGEIGDVIKHAWSLIGKDLISTETMQMEWSFIDTEANKAKITFYKPIIRLPYVLELQYYANSVISAFLMDSVVVNAVLAELNQELEPWRGCKSEVTVSYDAVIKKSLYLCNLLQNEFVFAPACTDLTSVITDTIDRLITQELISQPMGGPHNTHSRSWSNRMEGFASDEDEEDGFGLQRDIMLKINLTEESLNRIEFLRCVLSPLIESYWVVASSLVKLVNNVKEESAFFKEIHKTAEERLHNGLLVYGSEQSQYSYANKTVNYGETLMTRDFWLAIFILFLSSTFVYEESFAGEPLKNAIKLFDQWKVLESHTQDSVRLLYLSPSHNSEKSVQDVLAKVQQFRK